MKASGPLAGYRVIELGQLLAGPFAGCMLGYFGAEVIKIEPPNGGDPIGAKCAVTPRCGGVRWRVTRNR
jgi:crotonobetainyl-CoA:carnitine CoA-transferase CaiB-like acyl-CoA transferase